MREVAKFTTRLFKFDSWEEVKQFVCNGNLAKMYHNGFYYTIDGFDTFDGEDGDGKVLRVNASTPIDDFTMESRSCWSEELDLDMVVGALYDGETDGDYSGYNFEGC